MGHWHHISGSGRHFSKMGRHGRHFSPVMLIPFIGIFIALVTFKFWFPLLVIALIIGGIAMASQRWDKGAWRERWEKEKGVFKAQWEQWGDQWKQQARQWKSQWSAQCGDDNDEESEKRKNRPDAVRYHDVDLDPLPETLDEAEKPKRKRSEDVEYI